MKPRKIRWLMITAILAFAGIGVLITWGARPSLAQVRPPSSQTSQEFPAFTTGAVTVTGSVSIANAPLVYARQDEAWSVSVVGQPVVSAATPEFLIVGGTYIFTWAGTGDSESFRVLAPGTNGWLPVEQLVGGSEREAKWVNTALAATIKESVQ